jgi:hypothetical protein
MVDKFEHPERYDYAALIQAYGKGFDSVHIDRSFAAGEKLDWQGYKLAVDWMPGQTEFAMCLQGMIDGRKVAFTGDNLFANPRDPRQTGHEAMVAHNSAILEEGYIYGAEYLHRLRPDLIIGGHSFVMDRPAELIERYRHWAYDMRGAFQSLSADKDYRYWFDPFWVRAEPYRTKVRRGGSGEVTLRVRNFLDHPQLDHVEVVAPPSVEPKSTSFERTIQAGGSESWKLELSAREDAPTGVSIIALDITADGHHYGPLFDLIIEVE